MAFGRVGGIVRKRRKVTHRHKANSRFSVNISIPQLDSKFKKKGITMFYSLRAAVLLLMILAISGCSTPLSAQRGDAVKLDAPSDANMGMIVGRLDDTSSENKITYITIWDQKARARRGYEGIPVRMFPDGSFVAVNVVPGHYFVAELASGDHVAAITDMSVLQLLEVKPGKAAYWGTYKVEFKKGSQTFGIPSRANMTKLDDHEKRKVFAEVLHAAKGSGWEKVVKASM
jgi:hypothetical protein